MTAIRVENGCGWARRVTAYTKTEGIENTGHYRTSRVFISGSHHRVPSPERVPGNMTALILRSEYIATLEKKHTDTDAFVEFVKGRIIETQRELLRLFEENGGIKAAVGGASGGAKAAV